ncbi:MAG: leucine-rich repeat domain-containing protein [Firmicutes bacterium]|nr:leucine-rich repeat domain-containing protein [Bacillota bacterium]
MKKRIFGLILAFAMLAALAPTISFASTVASGECGADGDNLTWTLDSDGTLTISGEGAMEDYFIFSYSPWYDYCGEITRISIEDGVTSIGNYAFLFCAATEVAMTDSIVSIGNSSFRDCSSLPSITISSNLTSIGSEAFADCYSLAEIIIPASVVSIGDGAFYGCMSLEITADENNEYYSSEDGVLFNKDKTELVQYAKDKISPEYEIPYGVTSISADAFAHCLYLTSVTIPDSVTSIGSLSFYYCSSLTDIEIPSSVRTIDTYAFRYCTDLTSITIPVGITTIGESAFGRCTSLTDVYYGGSEEDWAGISIGSDNDYLTGATIHYSSVQTEQPDQSFTITDGVVTNTGADAQVATVIIASYDDNGLLLDVASESVTFDANETKNYDLAENERIFIWNSLKGMYPLTAE